jgi:AcrR family transcriptional regulator
MEHKIGTREKILEEARKIFSEKGFWGASVQEITDAARVNKAMLFYYFKSKENLYHTLIDELMGCLHTKILEKLADKTSPLDKLKALIETYGELFEPRTFSVFRICFQDIMGPGDRIRESLRHHIMVFNTMISDIIDEGIAQGIFRRLESHNVALSMMGMFYIFARHRIVMGEAFNSENLGAYFNSFILEGIRS